MYSVLRESRNYILKSLNRLGLNLCKLLVDKDNPRISLSVASDQMDDGMGAQIQRQLSLKALAHFLHFDFIPEPIKQIAIHPLDEFGDLDAMNDFLNDVNVLFGFHPNCISEFTSVKFIRVLTFQKLVRLILASRVMRQNQHLRVMEAYSLVDVKSQMYKDALQHFELNTHSLRSSHRLLDSDICIHYRHGAGGNAIYPGQKISRELNPQYFINLLSKIETTGKTITLFTDAPVQDLDFKPDPSQEYLWVGTPGYENGRVKVKGLELKKIFAEAGYEVMVVSGGDLITTLLSLASCKTLLMSRSSLSYVAALLNRQGIIFYPPNFWHPPLNHWVKGS